jgi:hypothetical protein
MSFHLTDPRHRRGPLGAAKKISMPVIHSVQTVLLSCAKFDIIPKRTKWTSTWPTSPRSSIGSAQNNFRAYCTFAINVAPILRQDYHYLQRNRNELPFDPHHLGVPSGLPKRISEPIAHSVQPCTYLACWLTQRYLQTDQNELPFDPCHLGSPSGVAKKISLLVAHLAQTVNLSCMEINTISKQSKMSF